jgi:hypothetical protein
VVAKINKNAARQSYDMHGRPILEISLNKWNMVALTELILFALLDP